MYNCVKLGTLTRIRTGKLDANASSTDGAYPFFTCSREVLRIATYSYDCECVLVAGNGDLNVKYYAGKFDAYQRTYIIESIDNGKLLTKYLYFFLDIYVEVLRTQSIGGVIKYIKLGNLADALIPLPGIEKQAEIVDYLETCNVIIDRIQQQLTKLDELVKSRFMEMFGDPISNEKKWATKKLDEACIAIVDCPHSTPNYTSENTGYMCIRTSIVKKNRIMWEKIEYIKEDEYYNRIQRKRPEKGDVIYTREGAILGIAAVIDRECNVALGQRSMLLSPDKKQCTSEFLSVAMNCDSFLSNALKGQSGSASPHINVGDIKDFQMIMPPISQQRQFSAFVAEVDKSKLAVEQSLEKLETLKKSLMQEYFG